MYFCIILGTMTIFVSLLNPVWYDKGVAMILDKINEERSFFSLEEFQSKYNIKTRFLDYGESICKSKTFLEWKLKVIVITPVLLRKYLMNMYNCSCK